MMSSAGVEGPPRGARREIELAARPANRLVWLARVFLRSLQIAWWLTVAMLSLPVRRVTRGGWAAAVGAATAALFTRLGATFIKIGQIMSTRPDVFPETFLEPLLALQDRVPPFPADEARRIIEEDFGRPLEDVFQEFNARPVASASVAQVHRAILRDAELPPTLPSKVVAVKIRRPGIVRRAHLDEAILGFGARLLTLVPTFSLISPVEAVREFCDAVNKQLDFRIEAENNRRFRKNFEHDPHAVFPALVDPLCSDRVLTMEFIDGVKDDQVRALGADVGFLARKGLEGMARMIFQHGFIHADLHPGNILFMPGNRIGLIDLGLVGVLDDDDRRRLALFYYYLAAGMATDAARWLYEEFDSSRLKDYAAFERDVAELVAMVHGRRLEEMQLTVQLAKTYGLLRKHRIRAHAGFTIANIAITVVEGIARKLDPKISVAREARPYIEAALALAVAAPAAKGSATAADAAVPAQIAGGRYRIRRLLGEGARKRVYLGRDTRLDRDVAIAFIRTEGLDEAGLARIDLESRAVARLADHPRIVPVYDTGEEDGTPYVVSQYMGGGTLSGRLLRASEHRLTLEEALRFGDQICQALEHAHAHGVVHRDVKPENVWLTEDGFAKLGDFGLARTLGRPDGTLDGLTVGTALYMPPEQALGRGVDHRSDLYSLGATLYELLTGRPPFEGDTVAEVIASHIHAEPDPPSRRNPQVPPSLDVVVLKLLAKKPENRFESAAAVRQALRDLPAPAAPPAPVRDEAEPAGIFVGREEEMQRLRKGFEEAVAGRGRCFVLVGEPGIGKTAAAELLASYAARRGSLVLTGRSFEGEGAPAFWPWVQILRAYLDGRDAARLESELGPGAIHVAYLVPQIRESLPELPVVAPDETEAGRFKLFDAVASFLRRAAMTQPLVLFLDDLHWADKPSLLLLQFLTRELAGARIFVVGAYRDVDVQHGHPLAAILPSLRRERAFERVLLRGLPEADVRSLVVAHAGSGAPEAFVREIHRETEGNPFFIEETLRHLREEGIIARADGRWTSRAKPEDMGLPEGIRQVIGRRLARLGDDCRGILRTAAVLGREFDTRLLESVAAVESERLQELLEEAHSARILEHEGHGARHRFSHALIRETLYAELGAGERVRLHRRIADALERLHAADVEPHLSELAYHFFEAVPAGEVGRAVEYATRAAEHADRQFAFEEAASFYDRALRALESIPEPHESQHCELLVRLGKAQARSGEYPKAKVSLARATELAERCGRPDVLARAALIYTGEEAVTMLATVDRDLAPLLERALAALPTEDSELRALVMGHLAAVLTFSEEQARRTGLFEEAFAIARRLGDDRTLARLLTMKLMSTWGADSLESLREGGEAIERISRAFPDHRISFGSRNFRALLACETGDIEAGLAELDAADRALARVGDSQTRYLASLVRTGLVVARADAAKAEAAIRETFELGGSGGDIPLAFPASLAQRAVMLWQQGRGDEVAAVVRQFLGSTALPSYLQGPYHLLLAVFTAERGEIAEARRIYEAHAADPAGLHYDTFRLAFLSMYARLAEHLSDVERAKAVYELLLPHAERNIVVGGAMAYGAVAKALGLAARTLSRLDDAVRHFERALHFERQMPFWLAETHYELARTLALRGAPGDRERAIRLLGESIEAMQAAGGKQVAAKALSLKLELEGIASASPATSIELVASSIEARRPDFAAHAAPDGTVTLLFSDVEDFTGMTERLGDRRAHEVIRDHNSIVRNAVKAHGGFEVELMGDGFLIAFDSARRGLECAIAIQQRFAAYNAIHPDVPLRVRMGLHTGEAIREANKFFGKTVILAARIAAHAHGGQILVSSLLRQLTESSGLFRFGRVADVALKGLAEQQAVCAVGWEGHEPEDVHDALAPAPVAAIDGNVFRRTGDFWTISFEGRAISLRDAKGLNYLSRLLAEPGRELHVLDLVGTAEPQAATSAGLDSVSVDLGSSGEVLDAQAKAEYRSRLEDLRSELEEAEAAHDVGRAARLKEETEFLSQELSAAFGLGGRSRKAGDAAERARKAVAGRINDTIGRIRKEHAPLALHLENAIRLGTFCEYQPEKPTTWRQ